MKAAHTASEEIKSYLTGEVRDTRQDYSKNNNQQGGRYIQRKDQYKGKNHQQRGRGGQGNRRGNNGDTGRGYSQPKAILKDGYCWSCGWKTNHKSPQCFRRINGHVSSATCSDKNNGRDNNKGCN